MEQHRDHVPEDRSSLYSQMPSFSKPCIASLLQLSAPQRLPSFCKPAQQDSCLEIKKGIRKGRSRFRYFV